MNHGCYSNAKYAFKMNRPSDLNKFVINNSVSDSGLSLDRYAQPTVLTKEIPDDWIHVKNNINIVLSTYKFIPSMLI